MTPRLETKDQNYRVHQRLVSGPVTLNTELRVLTGLLFLNPPIKKSLLVICKTSTGAHITLKAQLDFYILCINTE